MAKIDSRLICTLIDASYEHTYLEKLKPQQLFIEEAEGGIEILITQGQLIDKEMVLTLEHGYAYLQNTCLFSSWFVWRFSLCKTGHLASAIAEYN